MKDTLKSFIALLISIIVVHMVYIGYIRPEAAQLMEQASAAGHATPRALSIILKDYEQEICFILLFWGSFLLISAYREILKTNYLYGVDLIKDIPLNTEDSTEDGNTPRIDVNAIIERLDKEIPADCMHAPLVHTLRSSLWRYSSTNNVQNLSDAIDSSLEALAVKQDSDNTMIRYLIWAIPSVGFIGTVRGIGQALSQADQALAGDISGMTDSLGVAFNSTLVALLISIFLMFLFHQLQRLQDSQIVDTQNYCNNYLLRRIR